MNSMKNSLSIYVQSSIEIDEEKEALELSQYLDSLLEKYRLVSSINEGLLGSFGDKIKSLFNGKSSSEASSTAGGLFGGLLSFIGCAPSKYEKAMQDMYDQNAKDAEKRAKDLEDALEEARIAKMKAKNAARQSMLQQTNNAKIKELKALQARYKAEQDKWNALKNNSHKYTEEEMAFVDQSLESLSTILPPSEKTKAERIRQKIIKITTDPTTGELRSNEDILKDLQDMAANDPDIKELTDKYGDSLKDHIKDFTDIANDIVGNSEEVRNSEKTLESAQNELNNLKGTLSADEVKKVADYRKALLEQTKAVLESGDELSKEQEEFLSTLSLEEAKSLGGGELPKGFKVNESGLGVNFDGNVDELRDNLKENHKKQVLAGLNAEIEKAKKKATDDSPASAEGIRKYCLDNGLDPDKFVAPGEGITKEQTTFEELPNDAITDEYESKQKEILKKTVNKALPENPRDTINDEAVDQYVKLQHEGVDPAAVKAAEDRVKEAEDLVAIKKSMPERRKRILADIGSQEVNRKLDDELTIKVKVNGEEKELTLKEYKKQLATNPGEFVDADGNIITYDEKGDPIAKPKDPTSQEYKEYQMKRGQYLLNHDKYPEDEEYVVTNDGENVIVKDKDGNVVINKKFDDLTDDEKADVARYTIQQNNRETYKDSRNEAVDNMKKSLAKLASGEIKLKDKKPEDMDETELFLSSLVDENGEMDDAKFEEFVKNIKDDKLKAELSEYEDVTDDENDAEDDPEDTSDEENEAGADTDVESENAKRPTNPKKIWRKRKNKVTGKMSKSYFYIGKNAKRKSNNESISAEDYKKKVEVYKEKLAKWKETHKSEGENTQQNNEPTQNTQTTQDQNSLTAYIANLLEKQTSTCVDLKNYILEKLK